MMRHRPTHAFSWLPLAALLLAGSALSALGTADEPALPAEVVATLKGHAEIVYAVAFSPDGSRVLTGSFDRSLKLWETATGKEIQSFGGQGHQDLVLSVAISPSGALAASGASDKTVKLWDLQKLAGEPRKSLAHANLVDAVAFPPSGTPLATGSHDGTVRLWDVAKGEQLRQINAHTLPSIAPVYCLAWSPDGKQLVSGSLDHSLKLWDAASGALVRAFQGYKPKEPLPLFSTSTLGLLGTPLGRGPSFAVMALLPRRTENEQGHRDGVFCAAFSPDGNFLASGSSDRTIKLWNVADATVVREFSNPHFKSTPPQAHPGWVYSLSFTPSGNHLVSVGGAPRNHGYLAIWRVADGKLLYGKELPLGTCYHVALSPDGKLLALACGPRERQEQAGNAYLLRMPVPEDTEGAPGSR